MVHKKKKITARLTSNLYSHVALIQRNFEYILQHVPNFIQIYSWKKMANYVRQRHNEVVVIVRF